MEISAIFFCVHLTYFVGTEHALPLQNSYFFRQSKIT